MPQPAPALPTKPRSVPVPAPLRCRGWAGRWALVLLLVGAGLVPVSARSGAATDAGAALRAALLPEVQALQRRAQIPALGLVLVTTDAVLWDEGFGSVDARGTRPAGPATRWRAGSLAKPLTAIAVLQLAARGRVRLDDPLARHLPDFAIRSRFDDSSDGITLRRLLAHQSGLPTDLYQGMWSTAPIASVAPRLATAFSCFPPALTAGYSNLGYTLLGDLLERAGGQPFARYMEDAVLRPLGMADSAFTAATAGLATGHRDGRVLPVPPLRDLPAIGLVTNTSDLGALLRALLNNRRTDGAPVLPAPWMRALLAPQGQALTLDLERPTALGFQLDPSAVPGGGLALRHGGSTPGFSAELLLLPEHGLGVALLANADGVQEALAGLAARLLQRALGVHSRPAPLARALTHPVTARAPGRPVALPGDYATDYGVLRVGADQRRLCVCLTGAQARLRPGADGWYALAAGAERSSDRTLRMLAGWQLQAREHAGHRLLLARRGEQLRLLGASLPAVPVPRAWRERVGRWQVVNADAAAPVPEFRLLLHEHRLVLRYRLPLLAAEAIELPLVPVSDQAAVVAGIGRGRGDTLQAAGTGADAELRFSGLRARRAP